MAPGKGLLLPPLPPAVDRLFGRAYKRAMRRLVFAALCCLLSSSLSAQDPVISRGAPTTFRGEIVDIACYKQKSVSGGTGPAHVACAKECVAKKDGMLGILTDGDGLFKLWGAMTKDKYAKLAPYIGQTVEVAGAEVALSNNSDVRSFDVEKITVLKKKE